jgi:hypothetical protein
MGVGVGVGGYLVRTFDLVGARPDALKLIASPLPQGRPV